MDGFVSYDTLLGKLLLISIAVFVLWISYLMGTIIRIYHVRRRMRDYRRFVRSTYVRFGNPGSAHDHALFSQRGGSLQSSAERLASAQILSADFA